jgi:secondary thiamine-phosphate synthase enzyme
MEWLHITTHGKRQVIDLTDLLRPLLPASGEGLVTLQVQHTTAALTTADLDPGTDLDMLDFLESLVPKRQWRHPHDPAHAPDHLLASLIGPSVSLPYGHQAPLLGSWQRVVLVELAGPRERQVAVVCTPGVESRVGQP